MPCYFTLCDDILEDFLFLNFDLEIVLFWQWTLTAKSLMLFNSSQENGKIHPNAIVKHKLFNGPFIIQNDPNLDVYSRFIHSMWYKSYHSPIWFIQFHVYAEQQNEYKAHSEAINCYNSITIAWKLMHITHLDCLQLISKWFDKEIFILCCHAEKDFFPVSIKWN